MKEPPRQWMKIAAGIIFAYLILLWVVDFSIVRIVSNRYRADIRGKIIPVSVLPGNFKILEASAHWQNQFELQSGTIFILLKSPILQFYKQLVNLKGENLHVRILKPGNDSRVQKELNIDYVNLSVELNKGSDPIIQLFEMNSPELKIELKDRE